MQTPTAVAVDGVIPLGSLIRRYGCDVALNGNAVNITGAGYYDVDASVTVTPAAAGTVTITLYKDGVAVPGATASETAAANGTVDLSIPALVRQSLLRGRFRPDAGAHRRRCYGRQCGAARAADLRGARWCSS